MSLPTLYKARRVPTKQAVCAICAERTRGKTELVRLGYGVSVWLCTGHASVAFQTERSGRDFVLTLQRLWHAHGCLTSNRSRALDAHLERLRGPTPRNRPGSYAWPDIRRACEHAFAQGAPPSSVAPRARAHCHCCTTRPPSLRTIQRWHAQARWLLANAQPP